MNAPHVQYRLTGLDSGELGRGFVVEDAASGITVGWKGVQPDSGLYPRDLVGESFHADDLQDLSPNEEQTECKPKVV